MSGSRVEHGLCTAGVLFCNVLSDSEVDLCAIFSTSAHFPLVQHYEMKRLLLAEEREAIFRPGRAIPGTCTPRSPPMRPRFWGSASRLVHYHVSSMCNRL